jgi:hypothetical protein
MTLQLVLATAGSIALLVGLFGGGVKAKEIEVPKINVWPRILSSLIGIMLIGVAIKLPNPASPSAVPTPMPNLPTESASLHEQISLAPPLPTNTPPSTPTATQTPTVPPTDTPSPSPTPLPITIEIYANQSWQKSGVYVNNGDSIQIAYITGRWRVADSYAFTDPLGSIPGSDRILDPECHFPILPSVAGDQALVAKIGENGEPFNPFKRTRTGEGMLDLRLNDCDKYLGDNSGSVTIRIQLIR